MKFSVIIPVYNKADTIFAAVQSVYAQTVDDYEIIVVDDGSIDHPEIVLAELRSEKLRVISQENGGVSVARNTGIANAKGEYICFLDADDLWKPNHLEILNQLIEKYPRSCSFITSHEVILPNGSIIHSSGALDGFSEDFETDDLLAILNRTSYSVVHTNSICVSRVMLVREKIQFKPGVRIGEDTDVWYRLGLKNRVAISKNETTMYRREYSTATKETTYIENWVFVSRKEEILNDAEIKDNVKISVLQLIDRYLMTGCRECMLLGDKEKAKLNLSKVSSKKTFRYILTKIFTYLPPSVCKLLIVQRNKFISKGT